MAAEGEGVGGQREVGAAGPPAPPARAPAASESGPTRVCLLGLPRLERAGATQPLQRRDAALLALVVLGGPVPRSHAAAHVWPDADAEGARNNLRQRLFRLRRSTGIDLLGNEEVLALGEGVGHDAELDEARLLADPRAADGDLLGSLDFGDCLGLGDWVDAERRRWRARRAAVLAEVAARLEEQGDLARALVFAQRLVDDDPLLEHAHRRVMRLHYLRGDRAGALDAFGRLIDRLRADLHTAPSEETRELARLVERGTPLPAGSRRPMPPAVLRPPRLIGREAEWDALHAAAADGAAAIVVGEAGLGKSRLLGDFAALRTPVAKASARPGDSALPYALLARLLRALDTAPAEPWVRSELARLLPEWGAAPAGRLEPLHLRAAVLACLAELRGGDAATLVLDDLHFADAATLEMLPWLVAETRAVTWLIGARPLGDAGVPLAEALAALDALDAPAVRRIELRPLDRAAVHALVASLDLPGLDASVSADALWQHSGGNPLFLLETLRAWLRRDAAAPTGAALPAPAPLARLIEQRLERLSAPALRLARLAALAGSDFDLPLAAAVLGVHVLDLADPWHELEAAQIVRDAGFAHDLVLEATRQSVPQAIATALHAQIAAELARRGVAEARIAPHWQAAARWPEAAQACRGEELAHRRRAIAAWEAAGRAEAAFSARADSLEVLLLVESVDRAQALADDLLADAADAGQRLVAQLARAQTLLMAVRHGEAIEAATEARELAAAAGDASRERIAARFVAVSMAQAQRADEGVALLDAYRDGLPTDPASDDAFRYWSDLAYVLQAAGQRRRCAEALERAIEGFERRGDFAEMLVNLNNLAALKNSLGRLEGAIADGDRALALAERLGELQGIPAGALQIHQGLVRSSCGRFGSALRHFDAAAAIFAGSGQPTWVLVARNHLTNVWLQLGQTARAGQALPDDVEAVHAATRARRCIVASRLDAALGRDPLSALSRALEILGEGGDPAMRLQAQIEQLLWLEPDDALALFDAIEAPLQRQELLALAAKARWYAIRATMRAGRVEAAAALARPALTALGDVHPLDLYPPEALAIGHAALQAAGDDAAAQAVLQQALAWIDAALDDVPAPFRESFLHRNPVNRALLTQRR